MALSRVCQNPHRQELLPNAVLMIGYLGGLS